MLVHTYSPYLRLFQEFWQGLEFKIEFRASWSSFYQIPILIEPKKLILLLSEYCIMDCIYNEGERTFYIIDLTCWKGHPIYDSEVNISIFFLSLMNHSIVQLFNGVLLNFSQISSDRIKYILLNIRFSLFCYILDKLIFKLNLIRANEITESAGSYRVSNKKTPGV